MHSPEQPEMKDWKFIEELKTPLHQKISFKRSIPEKNEVNLSTGIDIENLFPDAKGTLETAFRDFNNFFKVAGIGKGNYRISVSRKDTECFEAYEIDIKKDECSIYAADTEGIRRALVFLEDRILSSGGPFVETGFIKRKPLVKTRISRCFFGPIKRPPMNRDELADDVDYYPEEYLNRLAHEGINGLWLSSSFADLCPNEIFPEHGKDSVKRLAKLRKTAEKCARYGIRIYLFCIEPRGFGDLDYLESWDILKKYPELGGHKRSDLTMFCTSSKTGQKYLEDCAYHIFSNVPELGGLIDINLGERPTNCYSAVNELFDNNCPRCSKRHPGDVIADTASAIARGMHRAVPSAQMISWLYLPIMRESAAPIGKIKKMVKEIAERMPAGVTFQYNFESMGEVEQLGKKRLALDYWLSWPGPSDIFSETAKKAVKNGADVSAKIQVGCSHEIATIPFVPVPGNLYEKYKAIKNLKVSTVMQCWYFGNYPGVMNKAAGELSFAPFPHNEDEFLNKLAAINWAGNEEKIVEAWKMFQKGYSNFPVNLSFTWYGPIHHSVVWPLYLYPVDKPIAPSWKFTFPLESGDRIGECVCYNHTLPEILLLLKAMDKSWADGVKILKSIENQYSENPERLKDIGLADALGIQFNSSSNVFSFYDLREKLPFIDNQEQQDALKEMEKLVKNEINNCVRLKKLCENDSRLGFHSEAEGYKYSAEKLQWRANLLQKLLEDDFPKLKKQIENNEPLFVEYTGKKTTGKTFRCEIDSPLPFDSGNYEWKAELKDGNLCFYITGNIRENDNVRLKIEPRRLWPVQKFELKNGKKSHENYKPATRDKWSVDISENLVVFKIPIEIFKEYHTENTPFRVNLSVNEHYWIKNTPLPNRLRLLDENPACLGWLFT